jgi:hypothetical protein
MPAINCPQIAEIPFKFDNLGETERADPNLLRTKGLVVVVVGETQSVT